MSQLRASSHDAKVFTNAPAREPGSDMKRGRHTRPTSATEMGLGRRLDRAELDQLLPRRPPSPSYRHEPV